MPGSLEGRYDPGHFIKQAALRDPAFSRAELDENVLEQVGETEGSPGQLGGRLYELYPSVLVDDGAIPL